MESSGDIGYRVGATGKLKLVLEEAFSGDKPVIIDCSVDYGESPKILGKFGGISIRVITLRN